MNSLFVNIFRIINKSKRKWIILMIISCLFSLAWRNAPFIFETGAVYVSRAKDSTKPECSIVYKIMKPNNFTDHFDEETMRTHPNLPSFLVTSESLQSIIPDITRIRWSGNVFQESWKNSPKFLLYSAHFDSRETTGLVVRIITVYNGDRPIKYFDNIFCQFWYSASEDPLISEIEEGEMVDYIQFSKHRLNPYVITCSVPQYGETERLPVAVSLTKNICKSPTNILQIHGSPFKKSDKENRENIQIGICGKALFYFNEDFSTRLIEWIEMMRAVGISRIFLYKLECHKNVEKVLEYYDKEGFVKLITFQLPPPYVQQGTFIRLWTKWRPAAYRGAQKIYLNDCMLRNKDDFDYLGVFDSDEIPVLLKHYTLQDFIKNLLSNSSSEIIKSIFLEWKYFYSNLDPGNSVKEIPKQFHILRHNRRPKIDQSLAEANGKSIHNTRHVLWIGCHRYLKPLSHIGKELNVSQSLAYTGHFSEKLLPFEINEKDLEEEKSLLRYKAQIISNVNTVVKKIFL